MFLRVSKAVLKSILRYNTIAEQVWTNRKKGERQQFGGHMLLRTPSQLVNCPHIANVIVLTGMRFVCVGQFHLLAESYHVNVLWFHSLFMHL